MASTESERRALEEELARDGISFEMVRGCLKLASNNVVWTRQVLQMMLRHFRQFHRVNVSLPCMLACCVMVSARHCCAACWLRGTGQL